MDTSRIATKLLSVFFFMLISHQSAKAQVLFGPKLGMQTSWIRYAQLYDGADYTEGMLFSPQIGGIYSFRLIKGVSFYSELYYAQRAKRERTTDIVTLMRSHTARYHFLELPLMLRVERPLSKRKRAPRAYINAGPHVGFWLAGSGKLESLETVGTTNTVRTEYSIIFSGERQGENTLFAEDANRLHFGLNAGAGLVIPMNKKGNLLQVDFRYTYGSTFMGSDLDLDIGSTDVEENYSFGHSFVSVSAAYAFYMDIWGLRKGKSIRRR